MIAIVAIDSHVTQVVDGTKGIHGMIPSQLRRAVSALTLSGSILGKVPSRRFMQTPRWAVGDAPSRIYVILSTIGTSPHLPSSGRYCGSPSPAFVERHVGALEDAISGRSRRRVRLQQFSRSGRCNERPPLVPISHLLKPKLMGFCPGCVERGEKRDVSNAKRSARI